MKKLVLGMLGALLLLGGTAQGQLIEDSSSCAKCSTSFVDNASGWVGGHFYSRQYVDLGITMLFGAAITVDPTPSQSWNGPFDGYLNRKPKDGQLWFKTQYYDTTAQVTLPEKVYTLDPLDDITGMGLVRPSFPVSELDWRYDAQGVDTFPAGHWHVETSNNKRKVSWRVPGILWNSVWPIPNYTGQMPGTLSGSTQEYLVSSYIGTQVSTSEGDLKPLVVAYDASGNVKAELYESYSAIDADQNAYGFNAAAVLDGSWTVTQVSAGNTNYTDSRVMYSQSFTIPANGLLRLGVSGDFLAGDTISKALPGVVQNGIELLIWDKLHNNYLTNVYQGYSDGYGDGVYRSDGKKVHLAPGGGCLLVNKRSTNYTFTVNQMSDLGPKFMKVAAGKTLLSYPYPYSCDLVSSGFPFGLGDTVYIWNGSIWAPYYLDDLSGQWSPSAPPTLDAGQSFIVQKMAAGEWNMSTPGTISIPATLSVRGDYYNTSVTNWYGISCAHGKTHNWAHFSDRVTICSDDVVYAFNESGTGSGIQDKIIISTTAPTTVGGYNRPVKQNVIGYANFYANQRKGVKITNSSTPTITVADPPGGWAPPAVQYRTRIN